MNLRSIVAIAGGIAVIAIPVHSQQQAQRFDAAVSRVRVDVLVTDDAGRVVSDLSADDFQVFEDGQRVEVLDLQFVDLGAGTVTQ